MATTLAIKILLQLTGTYKDVITDKLTEPKDVLDYDILQSLENGQGVDKAECMWNHKFNASDAGLVIDVFGGGTPVFKNFRGDVLSMDQIKFVLVRNLSLVTGEYITLGGTVQCLEMFEAASDALRIFPGGWNAYSAPGGAADSPSPLSGLRDELKITAAAGKTPLVHVVIVGENN